MSPRQALPLLAALALALSRLRRSADHRRPPVGDLMTLFEHDFYFDPQVVHAKPGRAHAAGRQPRPAGPQLPDREGAAARSGAPPRSSPARPTAWRSAHPRRLPLLLLGRQPRGARALRDPGGAVTAVHIAIGAALIAVNALAARLGRLALAPPRAEPGVLDPAARRPGARAARGARRRDPRPAGPASCRRLHLIYGLTPIGVAFFAEQLRLASAQTVLDRRRPRVRAARSATLPEARAARAGARHRVPRDGHHGGLRRGGCAARNTGSRGPVRACAAGGECH